MRKLIDIPPVWLAGALAIAWWQARTWPAGLGFGPVWADLAGGLLVGGGGLLLALSLLEMRRARTSFMPHHEAATLVTGGPFRFSRNPIYLGDAMILAGVILHLDAVLSLPLVPIFVWVVEKRFIAPEEAGLRRKFLAQYDLYSQQTRRWI